MRVIPFLVFDVPVVVNDWYLLIMIATFMVMLLIMGPNISHINKGISSMFRLRTPDDDLDYPSYSVAGYFFLAVASCISIGLTLVVAVPDHGADSPYVVKDILSVSGVSTLFLVFKLLLYQTVNTFLYKSQTTGIKPIRWNGFFMTVFSMAAFVCLVLTALTIFLSIFRAVLLVLVVLVLSLAQIGLILKLKTALFKNKCSYYGFILYLCALEFVPIAFMLALLGIFM